MTLCDPRHCSPSGSSARGISQLLQGIFLSQGLNLPAEAGEFFNTEPLGKPTFLEHIENNWTFSWWPRVDIWAFAIIIVLDSDINTMGHTLLLSRECSRLDCLECLQCLQCAVIMLITFRILITSLLPKHTHPHRKCFFYLSLYWNTVSHSYPQVPLLWTQPSSISNKHKTKSFCIQDLSILGFHYLWGVLEPIFRGSQGMTVSMKRQ